MVLEIFLHHVMPSDSLASAPEILVAKGRYKDPRKRENHIGSMYRLQIDYHSSILADRVLGRDLDLDLDRGLKGKVGCHVLSE